MSSKETLTTWDNVIHDLLDNKKMCDITFVVGEEPARKLFPAHRLVVSAVSNAFFHLCNGVPRRGIIAIPYADPDDFQVIVSHIYGKEIMIDSLQHAWNLLPLTKNYDLSKLKAVCRRYIVESIDVNNACSIFEEAEYQEEGSIILESFKFMTKNAKYLFCGKGLIGAHSNTVATIIRQDCINVESEYQLFSAILEWAKVESTLSKYRSKTNTLREIIEPLLPHIRFLRMGYYQLMNEPILYSILTKKEILGIILNLNFPGSYELPPWCNANTKKRELNSELVEKLWRSPCLCATSDEKSKSCKEAIMTYSSKMGIFLLGIGFKLFSHSLFVPWFSASISVKTEEKMETTLYSKREIVTIAEQIVKFKNPVYIKRGECFTITMKVDDASPPVHSCKPAYFFYDPFNIVHDDEEDKCDSCFCILCYMSLT